MVYFKFELFVLLVRPESLSTFDNIKLSPILPNLNDEEMVESKEF